MNQHRRPLIPWWYWVWLGHLVFIGFMYLYMYTPYKPDWFKLIFSSISLAHEQNYAVWWSGLCLFFGSSLFYRIAGMEESITHSWRWIVLSVTLLALAVDEIGSLHEMVSKHYGWEGLIPFALLFGAGFSAALFSMFRQRGYRIPAFLVLSGIGLFGSVASLEFVEHNIRMDFDQQRNRLIFEEGAELFAMSLIIAAGLIVLGKKGATDRRLSNIVGGIRTLYCHENMVFLLFAINFFLVTGFAFPYAGKFSEGNPAAVYAIFLYFVLGMISLRLSHNSHERYIWWGFSLVFIFTSICQIHSFSQLMNKLLFNFPWFTAPPDTWLITLAPMAALYMLFLRKHWTTLARILPDLALFTIISAILYTDNHSPMIYALFSSCTGFLCYRLLSQRMYAVADQG